ncbi:MAG: PglZ domain-containing protein [Megasphaera elsdenii]|nr:PglZ domain-containing protein [Megasphaera elsdenii]
MKSVLSKRNSDAFRLEAAKELAARFQDDENCSVEEKVHMAPLPSITLLGMAELLPHDTLELTRDDTPKILLDGKPCASTAQREKLLQQGNPRSAAILYDELIAMKVSELKRFSAGKEVIYVYHNRIDATGEASKTENSVFQAADQTIDEIFRLVKRLSKSGNIYRFLITADHGFLYIRKALDPTDKLDTVEAGKTWMTDRRFLLTDQPMDREGIYSIPLGKSLGNEDPRSVVLAKGMSVFKCHGGMNGASPQELLVPCLFISTRKGLVDTEDVGLALINDIRKIAAFHVKFSFYQEQAISASSSPLLTGYALKRAVVKSSPTKSCTGQKARLLLPVTVSSSCPLICRRRTTTSTTATT